MAKEYKVGEKYYLPVTVEKVTDGNYGVTIGFDDGAGEDTTLIGNDPDLLLTADEIATDINTERAEIMESLGKQNLELSKQNEELGTKVDDLEVDLQNAKAAIDNYHEVEHRRADYTDKQTQEINRKNKEIEILIDRITKLEAELTEERKKNNV